ncbi:hypothetical protein [Phyllobacterium sp. UNC302MFCol5.2]|uniref:hypothetical protein n=1 Tax=Phyllobacterium sp. UNC302MFCol5.2 TaxID=1449065 RepID=UPI001FDAC1DA|nr:hypothetical protein [Phyllobacterium sp. UNC302MFCol5.2]
MGIEFARYMEAGQIFAIIEGMECSFPDDVSEQQVRDPETDEPTGETIRVSANPQRQMVLDWEAEGNTIEPYSAPVTIPDRVSRRQFRLQLIDVCLLSTVEGWIATQDERTQAAYADSGTFLRSDEMLQAGFSALGFTTEQIDAFFTEAAEL